MDHATHGPRARALRVWLLLAAITLAALYGGMAFRIWTFEVTTPIRFRSDIERGHGWGLRAYNDGYLDLYEIMADEQLYTPVWLDYAPLRLLVMRQWAAWLEGNYEHDEPYRPGDWTYHKPVLLFNAALSAVAALAGFLLVVVWVRKSDRPPEPWGPWEFFRRRVLRKPERPPPAPALTPRPFRGYFRATVAALLIWFNPAIVLSAQGWPTWDMWVIPFFLVSVLLASTEWWFCAGVAVGIGAMFKGQQLFCASLFVLWPVFQGRFGAAGRFIAGLVLSFALIASPWLITYHPGGDLHVPRVTDWMAIAWVAGMAVAVPAGAWLMRIIWQRAASASAAGADVRAPRSAARRRLRWPLAVSLPCLAAGMLLVTAAATWPWWGAWGQLDGRLLAALAGVLVLCAGLPARHARYIAATVAGVGLLATMAYFHGTSGWFRCSFIYGTVHPEWMVVGQTSNLPGILQFTYGWREVHDVLFTLPAHCVLGLWPAAARGVDVRIFFFSIFVLLLVATSAATAMHDRMNSAKFLVAVTTPWVLFFTIPPEIHERYLLYAAGVGMVAVGYSYGMLLMGLFLTLTTWMMTIHVMLNSGNRSQFLQSWGPRVSETLYKYVHNSHPGIGWAVCLACLVYLWVTLSPDRSKLRLRGGAG